MSPATGGLQQVTGHCAGRRAGHPRRSHSRVLPTTAAIASHQVRSKWAGPLFFNFPFFSVPVSHTSPPSKPRSCHRGDQSFDGKFNQPVLFLSLPPSDLSMMRKLFLHLPMPRRMRTENNDKHMSEPSLPTTPLADIVHE
jgi:hypothetical protein